MKKIPAWLKKLKKAKPPKPNTEICGGIASCLHEWQKTWYNKYLFGLKCKLCGARTERATTSSEQRNIVKKNRREQRQIRETHRLYHDFLRRFKKKDIMKFDKSGYDFICAMEKYIKKHPQIKQVGVDDSCHTNSDLFLIPHERRSEYWGTTVLYVPQCTGEPPIEFFLYPGHLDSIIEILLKIQKHTKALNKDKDKD